MEGLILKQNENGQSAAKREWRIIEEDNNYMISNDGYVKRISSGKVLCFGNKKRYYTVALHSDGNRKDRYVHRLVAQAFIPNDDITKKYVNHKDHNIHNNCVDNLEWCTSSENARHSYENHRRDEEYHTVRVNIQKKMADATKKSIDQYDCQNNFLQSFPSLKDAERQTGIKSSNISRVLRGRGNTAGGYIWKYHESSTTKCSENPTETAPNLETKDDIV